MNATELRTLLAELKRLVDREQNDAKYTQLADKYDKLAAELAAQEAANCTAKK